MREIIDWCKTHDQYAENERFCIDMPSRSAPLGDIQRWENGPKCEIIQVQLSTI